MSLLNTARFLANHPLTRNRKVESFANALRWQIGIRMVPGDVLVDWVGGAKFITGRGDAGITGNIYAGLHDFADMGYLLHATGELDLFVDVGANVGSYTLLACAAKGARGYCFEPVPSTYSRLLRNLTINNLSDRVVAMNIGISDGNGTLLFTSHDNVGNHVIADNENPAHTVAIPVQSLDIALGNESPSIIKIDVEGFENKVLDGAKKTLSKPSLTAVILEVSGPGSRYGFDHGYVPSKMKDYDFHIHSYDPFTRMLVRQNEPNLQGNTLFIRNASTVQAKLITAPPFLLGSQKI